MFQVKWLKEEERNTIFFHNSLIQHKHHSRIISLKDKKGNKLTQHKDI